VNQLSFVWPQRFEIPAAHWSYIEDGVVKRGSIGWHSVDVAWPWFKPWGL
jgi:hypothetical protein